MPTEGLAEADCDSEWDSETVSEAVTLWEAEGEADTLNECDSDAEADNGRDIVSLVGSESVAEIVFVAINDADCDGRCVVDAEAVGRVCEAVTVSKCVAVRGGDIVPVSG